MTPLYFAPLSIERRTQVTRLLSWIGFPFAWWALAQLAIGPLFVLGLMAGIVPTESLFPALFVIAAILLVGGPASWMLTEGRHCDRCGERLFSIRPFGAQRDYRAPTGVFYESAAMWRMARTGKLHCWSCGHLDGAKLDNDVNAK